MIRVRTLRVYLLRFSNFQGAGSVQICSTLVQIKKTAALRSGLQFVHLMPVFNYWDYLLQMPCHTAAAVWYVILGRYFHIQHAVYQLIVCHAPVYRMHAGRSANQVSNLIRVKFPAHKLFKSYNLCGLFIRPPVYLQAWLLSLRVSAHRSRRLQQGLPLQH